MPCQKCNKEVPVFPYDQFGSQENPINYCSTCLTEILYREANSFVKEACEVCNSPLVAGLNDMDVSLEDGVIWFRCPKSKEDNEEHTEIGEYLTQPSDEE